MIDAHAASHRKRIVLLGIGHTNAHIVKEWASDPLAGCDLVCISNYPTATYSGMLPGTLGRQFSDDEMRIDLRSLTDRSGAELVVAETNGIDLDAGKVLFSDRVPLSFDALSIGVGSVPAGAQQYADVGSMVPIKPMQTFLQRLDARLRSVEPAQTPNIHVAIVGGGVATVEIAFCLLEQFQKRNVTCDIEIFTSGQHVAGGMSRRSIHRIEKLLDRRGIRVRCGHRVVNVDEQSITTDNGITHRTDCVIWATGAAGPPLLGHLGLQRDDLGFLATSKTLQSLSDPRIFAVGDSGTIVESPSPKAGVYAVRQCPILWDNLRAFITGGGLREFSPQGDFLKILNTGDGKALLEYGWFTAHARWCWTLKTWIDRRFIQEFQIPESNPSLARPDRKTRWPTGLR